MKTLLLFLALTHELLASDWQVGDRILGDGQEYRLEAFIGEGGMGKVFRARRLSDGAVVALKKISPSLGRDSWREIYQNLSRVAGYTKTNPSQYVLQLHEVSYASRDQSKAEKDNLIIVSDFLYSQSLEKYHRSFSLRDVRTLSPEFIARRINRLYSLTIQLLAGLEYLGAGGITHNDLKPANIIMRVKSNESYTSKHYDTGKAWPVIVDLDAAKRSRRATSFYTSGFVAPERNEAKGLDGKASLASDFYSLGIILNDLAFSESVPVPYESDRIWKFLRSNFLLTSETLRKAEFVRTFIAASVLLNPGRRVQALEELGRGLFTIDGRSHRVKLSISATEWPISSPDSMPSFTPPNLCERALDYLGIRFPRLFKAFLR